MACRAERNLDCRTRTCDGDGGGSCQPSVDLEPDEKCTFVQTFEAGSFTSTPGRDPNGNIVWTCAVVSFQVFGVCVCQ